MNRPLSFVFQGEDEIASINSCARREMNSIRSVVLKRWLAFLAIASCGVWGGESHALTIAEEGEARAVIVTAAEASPAVAHAASELARFLHEITGGGGEITGFKRFEAASHQIPESAGVTGELQLPQAPMTTSRSATLPDSMVPSWSPTPSSPFQTP